MNTPDDNALKAALKTWKVSEPLPPRFQEQVWRRIERAGESPRASESFWSLLGRALERAFARRSVAVSYIVSVLIVGMIAGYLKGQFQQHRWNDELAARYVQSLAPSEGSHH